jgi:hypothetical protein
MEKSGNDQLFLSMQQNCSKLASSVGTWPDQGMAWPARVFLGFVATFRSPIPTRSELGRIQVLVIVRLMTVQNSLLYI